MTFVPPVIAPLVAPLATPGGTVVIPWYLLGGVTAAQCVAAYAAKGAASQNASYTNLNSPGTYTLSSGAAPSWDATNGWTGDGSTQYLDTGIVPLSGWSAIVLFSNEPNAYKALFGNGEGGKNLTIEITQSAFNNIYYSNGQTLSTTPRITSGVLAVAGQTAYKNGSAEIGTIGAWSGTATKSIYILAVNGITPPVRPNSASIQAIAFYNIVLSSIQIGLITTAMSAL